VQSHSQPVTKVFDEEVLREDPFRMISAGQKDFGILYKYFVTGDRSVRTVVNGDDDVHHLLI
jgi:hypothetical protein